MCNLRESHSHAFGLYCTPCDATAPVKSEYGLIVFQMHPDASRLYDARLARIRHVQLHTGIPWRHRQDWSPNLVFYTSVRVIAP